MTKTKLVYDSKLYDTSEISDLKDRKHWWKVKFFSAYGYGAVPIVRYRYRKAFKDAVQYSTVLSEPIFFSLISAGPTTISWTWSFGAWRVWTTSISLTSVRTGARTRIWTVVGLLMVELPTISRRRNHLGVCPGRKLRCCGSGFKGSLNPYPGLDSQSGSGSRKAKTTHKHRKVYI